MPHSTPDTESDRGPAREKAKRGEVEFLGRLLPDLDLFLWLVQKLKSITIFLDNNSF
jgi:hypothetical protein